MAHSKRDPPEEALTVPSVLQEPGRPLLQGALPHAGLLGARATQGQSALAATMALSYIFVQIVPNHSVMGHTCMLTFLLTLSAHVPPCSPWLNLLPCCS